MPAALANRFEAVLTGSPEGWWTTVLGAKDAGLAFDIAAAAGSELPLAELLRDRYEAAAKAAPEADISALATLYRDLGDPAPATSSGESPAARSDHDNASG